MRKNDLTVQFEDFRRFIYLRIDVVSIWIHTWKSDPKILVGLFQDMRRSEKKKEKLSKGNRKMTKRMCNIVEMVIYVPFRLIASCIGVNIYACVRACECVCVCVWGS